MLRRSWSGRASSSSSSTDGGSAPHETDGENGEGGEHGRA